MSPPLGAIPCRRFPRPAAGSLRPRASRPRIGRSTGRSPGPRRAGYCGGRGFGTAWPPPRASALSRPLRKNFSTSWLTSVASRVPASYMHRTTPASRSRPLSRAATASIVSNSLLRPCRAKKCGCKGMTTSPTAAKRADGQQAQRRRAVDQQEIDRRRVGLQLVAQNDLSAGRADKLHFGRHQVGARRDHPEVVCHLAPDALDRGPCR